MTQKDRILSFLRNRSGITCLQAERLLGIHRLAARIYDLEEQGYVFPRRTITVKNRYGEACRVTRYYRPTVTP